MENKIVLITGGSSGIGRAIGNYLSAKGYTVYGTTRNLSSYPDFDDFKLLELDVHDEESIQRAVQQVIANHGKLDVLINNAGVGITGPIEETPMKEIDKAFDTNFKGPIRMIQAVMPQMRLQKGGQIINITSIAGYMGLPFRGIYSASKAALEMVTESLRMEGKRFGIVFTTIAPGDVATNIAAGRYHVPLDETSPYKQTYGHSLELMNADVDAGQDPKVIALKVYKVLQQQHPKVRYPEGVFLQKFSIFLKKILPGRVYERLLLRHYKL